MFPNAHKKVRKSDFRDGWYTIGVSDAQWLLDHSAPNRPLQEARAVRLAEDIRANRYRENGEPIIFNEKGQVIDGQHRLRAIVLANRSIIVYCVFGVPSKYFATLDQGACRGGSDTAALMDFQNAAMVAAIAKLAILYEHGAIASTGSPRAVPMDQLREYMATHRAQLIATATLTSKHKTGITSLLPVSHVGFIVYKNLETKPERVQEFLDKISTGAGLVQKDPILLLRNRMTELIGQKHRLSQREKLALLIKTWNAYLKGSKLGILAWRTNEAFPELLEESTRNA